MRALVEGTEAAGGIDVVVANATANAAGASEAEFAASFDVDLMQSVRLASAVLDAQPERPFSMVCLGSIDGMSGATPHHAYSVMNKALLAWTKNAAVAYGPRGIRERRLSWGDPFRAAGGIAFASTTPRGSVARRSHPRRAYGHTEEVAAVVTFLASPRVVGQRRDRARRRRRAPLVG